MDADTELARLGCRLLFTFLWLRPGVRGREQVERLEQPCVVVCERRSRLDPLLLMGYLPDPVRFLFSGPPPETLPLTFLESRLGNYWFPALPVEEASRPRLQEVRERMLHDGLSLAVFREPALEPLIQELSRPSGSQPGLPVVPCRLVGTEEVLPPGAWIPRFAAVRLVIGAPLSGPLAPGALDQALRDLEGAPS